MALFELDTPYGRLRLESLFQTQTYSGLLMGYPHEELNRRLLAELSGRVARLFGEHVPAHVIEPPVVFPPVPADSPRRLGPQAEMPAYCCLGLWTTADFGRVLGIAWFQGVPGLPSEPRVLHDLRAVDFAALSVAYEP